MVNERVRVRDSANAYMQQSCRTSDEDTTTQTNKKNIYNGKQIAGFCFRVGNTSLCGRSLIANATDK